ncbi:hypothetical protein MTR67_002430 [Solanum verrucosum]|uniref:Uncharacterized protein n=1 Tax=Solanum verrucosum TaxID=315347 RepID=A0AAF0PTN0_SOLVR|nr:hypothetical protein MTR67_002430 [Solanum verrucosum]
MERSRVETFTVDTSGESSSSAITHSDVLGTDARDDVIPLLENVKLAMKWSSQRVAYQFREAVPYRTTTKNVKRLKAKAERR